MLVPIILGSDKTTVSVATGQTDYYPLYLSIGNVRNTVRRAHRNAVALIGFLAMPKSKLYLFDFMRVLIHLLATRDVEGRLYYAVVMYYIQLTC